MNPGGNRYASRYNFGNFRCGCGTDMLGSRRFFRSDVAVAAAGEFSGQRGAAGAGWLCLFADPVQHEVFVILLQITESC